MSVKNKILSLTASLLLLTMLTLPAGAVSLDVTDPDAMLPVDIILDQDNKEIRKVYDLSPNTDPSTLPMGQFERDGLLYARRGWFLLKIPALLPKKGTGSPIYIQQYLYPALRRYFDGKPPARYRSCVLAYRHVYQRGRPERAYRDHDNIEVNMVTDIITLYLLPDDAPRRCAHYYCSAAGEVDCTEVYVVPASRFPEWLAAEQADDLKEDTLYETSEIWA